MNMLPLKTIPPPFSSPSTPNLGLPKAIHRSLCWASTSGCGAAEDRLGSGLYPPIQSNPPPLFKYSLCCNPVALGGWLCWTRSVYQRVQRRLRLAHLIRSLRPHLLIRSLRPDLLFPFEQRGNGPWVGPTALAGGATVCSPDLISRALSHAHDLPPLSACPHVICVQHCADEPSPKRPKDSLRHTNAPGPEHLHTEGESDLQSSESDDPSDEVQVPRGPSAVLGGGMHRGL